MRYAQGLDLSRFLYRLVHGEIKYPRHGADLLAYSFTRAHEHGVNEGIRSQASLAHQIAKFFGAAQTSKAGNRECHGIHSMILTA
jgi:hypothetical protein